MDAGDFGEYLGKLIYNPSGRYLLAIITAFGETNTFQRLFFCPVSDIRMKS